ncbi:MAG: hypothetical protein ACI4UM_06805 [Succinivibrio sp.]
MTYQNGLTEVSAFVNSPGNTQLQSVLCSNSTYNNYRFTLLLPQRSNTGAVIKVKVITDEISLEEYCEVSGNSIDFQVDENLLLTLPETTKLKLVFESEDAKLLNIPSQIEIPMTGADLTLRNVASECTVLCLNNGYKCNFPLLSSLLWPSDRFEGSTREDIDTLCTKQIRPGLYRFRDSEQCRLALDNFFQKDGIGALSPIEKVFNDRNSSFSKYMTSWNEAVSLSPASALNVPVKADGREWYLSLYSLVGRRHIREFPVSYYSIKGLNGDSTTAVYDTDNRYEMEMLKYSSVLYRRVNGNVSAINAIEMSLKYWSDFYRQLSATLPAIPQAQAIRPIVYRTMLMRIWNLAGKPQSIRLLPEYAFRQGSGGKTITGEPLESECSFFEGVTGDEFYYASDNCIKGVSDYMRVSPLKTTLYDEVEVKWNTFAREWIKSPFYNEGIEDAVGEHVRGNLNIALLSMIKQYGFGDYFLVRECISSRDSDICQFESKKMYNTYNKEFNYRLDSISNVSENDGKLLNSLNTLWLDYYEALEKYLADLVKKSLLEEWRADLVKSVACVVQTNALLNFPYDRAELPDISLEDGTVEGDILNVNGMKMSIEQDRYSDSPDDNSDPDEQIDDSIVVPE